MVGLNLSPMAVENESVAGITMENYRALISHILDTTDMNIALIPHVVWKIMMTGLFCKVCTEISVRQAESYLSKTAAVKS